MRNPWTAPTIRQALLSAEAASVPDREFYDYLRMPNGTFKTT
ncbi:MAG: hypothetical protein ACK5Q5_23205 [Planctomycetaceae bacterium]